MKKLLLYSLTGLAVGVGAGCTNKTETTPNANYKYLVQAPGLLGPNMTYICNEATNRGNAIVFLDCTGTFTNESVSEILNGVAIKLEEK